eukprot:2843373-Karenia_brevis.AAC.1
MEAVIPILGDASHVKSKALRRLHFDCFHQVAAEALKRSSVDDESRQQQLPAPERQVRLDLLRKRLLPIKIKGELLPSNNLIDKFVGFAET